MCRHPEVPIYEGRAAPSLTPVRCVTCGGELELVCKGQGCDAPLGEKNRVRGQGIPRAGTRTYRPKPCARCFRTFTPSGPRSIYCGRDNCQSPIAQSEPREAAL